MAAGGYFFAAAKMEEIMRYAKKYKNIILEKNPVIEEVKRALAIVRQYIWNKKLLLYGGMAIDFALKNAGHEGIYDDDILPDYDFFTFDFIRDSFVIEAQLREAGFEGGQAINGLHLSTRRVRINKVDYVADLSFLPEPYYSRVPVAVFQNRLTFVHPDYQRIDLHVSLSNLYAGAPMDFYKHRLVKDTDRFALMDKHCPLATHKVKPITDKKYIIANFDSQKTIDLRPYIGKDLCIGGIAAYAIYCDLIKKFAAKKKISLDKLPIKWLPIKDGQISVYFKLEIYTRHEMPKAAGRKFAPLLDHYPDSKMVGDVIYFNNKWMTSMATKLGGEYSVLNIHRVAAQFLFKYFMLGGAYMDYYKSCLAMIKFAQDNKMDMSSPFFINGNYYGDRNTTHGELLGDRSDREKGYMARPYIFDRKKILADGFDFGEYDAYIIDGREIKD